MKNSIVEILGNVTVLKPDQFYEYIAQSIKKKEKKFIVTANPEIVMLGRKNEEMLHILKNKAIVIPDGIGVVKAVNALGRNAVRNTGIEFVVYLLDEANKHNLDVFIYGAKEEVLNDFKEKCTKNWPNIHFSGLYNGYTSNDKDVIKEIKKNTSDIYFVALGTPRQELFINSFYDEIGKGICVGIGGSMDVLSGHVKRAPQFFLTHNLEWLYRITTEPKRMQRFIKGNIMFVFVFIKDMMIKRLKYSHGNETEA